MAGEWSLLCALAAEHLIKVHMAHSRSPAVASAGTPSLTGFGTPAVVEKEKECGLVNDCGLSPSSTRLKPL